MKDVIVGIIIVLIGALFCFRGWLAMRIVIPIWGAFAGFLLGAGLIQGWTGDGFLSTSFSWIIGIIFAIVFFFLAYLYFEVSVILAMTFIGFALGVALMSAIGVTWSWVLVVVGLVVGLAFGVLAIATDLPMGVLAVVTALGGASAITAGVMLIVGTVNLDDFDDGVTTKDLVRHNAWWYVLYLGLAIVGIVAQIAFAAKVDDTLRETWTESGGKHLRSAES
jgi:hypothetical protein